MSNWSLRARLTAVLATTLGAFALVASAAYFAHSRAEDRLAEGFAEQLAVLTELPGHRIILRRVDAFGDNYLTSRDASWLGRRAESARDFRESHRRIGGMIRDEQELKEWRRAGEDFDAYDAGRLKIFDRLKRGELGRGEAIQEALDGEALDRLFEDLTRFGRLSFAQLDAKRRDARRAAIATFAFVMAFGLIGSVAVAAAVSRIVVAPVWRLRAQASSWKLGEPWTLDMKDGPPELLELFATLRSMADQLNAQFEKERQAGKLKSQLVSGVSHEFNNALAVIHTAHALLKENEPDTAATAPWHEMLAANIRALSTMATNLLNLGRLEAGKFALDIQRVDAAAMLRSAAERLGVLAKRKKLSVALEVPPEAICAADPDALGLVVANLFTNAVKYTHEGGSIALGARVLPGGGAEIFVRDTGIGVAAGEREKIFGGYYRTEEGKREAKGFGVGLALSRMILEAHGTELELESESGKGSRFFFALPAWTPGTSPDRVG